MVRLRTISFRFMTLSCYLAVMKKNKCYPHALNGDFFFGKCRSVCVCVCVITGDFVNLCNLTALGGRNGLIFVSLQVVFVQI